MLTMADLPLEEMDREKAVLHAANYRRGYKATELVTWIRQLGYVGAAGKASFTRLCDAAAFTRSRAPQHHCCIEALLAIRAVEHVENGAQATRVQSAYLAQLYHCLGEEDRQWCRQQLSLTREPGKDDCSD